jgi:hypothetical protein
MPENRSYVSPTFILNLDGKPCGFIKSASGGGAVADVVSETVGPDYFVRKHIAGIKYEELVIETNFAMTPSLFDWIAGSWNANHVRKNGAIQTCDFNRSIHGEQEFFQGMITETVVPACDASSKDAGMFKVKIAPEYTRTKTGSGKVDAAYSGSKQKAWLPSNFKLEIDGLDATKVNRIDSFSVKQKVVVEDVGDARDYMKEPGKLEFPNLRVTLSDGPAAQKWYDWFEDFVMKGNCGEDKEKNGTLMFLTADLKTTIASIKLEHLGIFKLSPEPAAANTEKIKRITAELYCERMQLSVPGAKG